MITTDSNHLDVSFLHNDSSQIVSLEDVGRRQFFINMYEILPSNNIQRCRSMPVEQNSGFLSVSEDDKLLAVGVVKKDAIQIIDNETGDLLINLSGPPVTKKNSKKEARAYFGTTRFVPIAAGDKNSFLEWRVTKVDKSTPKESVLRYWDLGFRENEGSGSESDDEVEEMRWEIKQTGKCQFASLGPKFILTCEDSKTITWIDRSCGTSEKVVRFGEWVSSPVVSASRKHVAVANHGKCTVLDATTGEVASTVLSPVPNDQYPMVPVAFVDSDRWLVARIDLDMTLIVSDWTSQSPSCLFSIRGFGGTITSNAVAVSRDEKHMMCWPYGCIEVFDLQAILRAAKGKRSDRQRWACVWMRVHVREKGAQWVEEGEEMLVRSIPPALVKFIVGVEDCLFRMMLSFV